jgi:hypothetical protein
MERVAVSCETDELVEGYATALSGMQPSWSSGPFISSISHQKVSETRRALVVDQPAPGESEVL